MQISIEEVNKLKRFDIEHVNREESDGNLYTDFDMVERPDGDYVKFSDIQALFESKGIFTRKKPYKAVIVGSGGVGLPCPAFTSEDERMHFFQPTAEDLIRILPSLPSVDKRQTVFDVSQLIQQTTCPIKAIDEINNNPVHIAQDIIDGLTEDRKHNKLSTRLTNSITEAAKMVDDINRRGGSFHDWLINPCKE